MKRTRRLRARKGKWQMVTIAAAAVIAASTVFAYTSSVTTNAREEQQLVGVYLAQKAIPVGTSFAQAMGDGSIESKQFPMSAQPTGAITSLDDANKSLVATQIIQPGQILVDSLFGLTAANTGALTIPEGSLAVTVSIADPARVASFVQPGSEISIFVTGSLQNSDKGVSTTQVLLPRVSVLAIGEQVASASSGQVSINSPLVTLAVTPNQAKKLIYASQNLSLYFGLRTSSVDFAGSAAITSGNIFSE